MNWTIFILGLLLQASPLFDAYATEAAARLRVPTPIVEVVPVNRVRAQYTAWVHMCFGTTRECGVPRIYLTQDVAVSAPPPVFKYLAYHEVCHIRDNHYMWPPPSMDVTHLQVETCLNQTLGRKEVRELEGWYASFSITLRKLRRLQGLLE